MSGFSMRRTFFLEAIVALKVRLVIITTCVVNGLDHVQKLTGVIKRLSINDDHDGASRQREKFSLILSRQPCIQPFLGIHDGRVFLR